MMCRARKDTYVKIQIEIRVLIRACNVGGGITMLMYREKTLLRAEYLFGARLRLPAELTSKANYMYIHVRALLMCCSYELITEKPQPLREI